MLWAIRPERSRHEDQEAAEPGCEEGLENATSQRGEAKQACTSSPAQALSERNSQNEKRPGEMLSPGALILLTTGSRVTSFRLMISASVPGSSPAFD